jgi:hypothetical protein
MFTTKYSKNRNNYKGTSKKVNKKKFAAGGLVDDDDSSGGGFAKTFARTTKALSGLRSKDSWLSKPAAAPAAADKSEGDEKEEL